MTKIWSYYKYLFITLHFKHWRNGYDPCKPIASVLKILKTGMFFSRNMSKSSRLPNNSKSFHVAINHIFILLLCIISSLLANNDREMNSLEKTFPQKWFLRTCSFQGGALEGSCASGFGTCCVVRLGGLLFLNCFLEVCCF